MSARSRSFSTSWMDRPPPPRIATVKPVAKSLSEDDLLKVSDEGTMASPRRVFSRFNVTDLSLLKKDNIIGELEKCLEELESEHGYAQRLGDVYEKVESERNQLLEELDMAFQDLQKYMQKQKQIESDKSNIETDREELHNEKEELQKENEYLKAVLSNRNEIISNRLQEENHQYAERIKELEVKNSQHLDEINELYEERQTLITSLLNLQSSDVEDVIRKTSRSSSLCSREEGIVDLEAAANIPEVISQFEEGNIDREFYIRTLKEVQSENDELKEAFKRIRKERDTAEQEIDQLKEEKDNLDKSFSEKIKEYQELQDDRNEKNLCVSKLNMEKRTLQRQYDHLREQNRTLNLKMTTITKELDSQTEKPRDRIISGTAMIKEFVVDHGSLAKSNTDKSHLSHGRTPESDGESLQSRNKEAIPVNESEKIADPVLNEKLKELESVNKELKTLNKDLKDELISSENMCVMISQKYESESDENKSLKEQCNQYEKDLDELKRSTSEKYFELTVEYDNEKNYNQKLQTTIDKLNGEKESIKSELHSYKSEVIEKIKRNLDALEKERLCLLSEKEILETTVKDKQLSEQQLKETCSKLLKQVDETKAMNKHLKSPSESEDISIVQSKYNQLQRDYDIQLQKFQQLEKSVSEGENFNEELKRLKETNEMLQQRSRSLEADYDANVKLVEDEKLKYASLLSKYENKCKQYEIGCQQYDSLEQEHKEVCDNYDELVLENSNLCQQFDDMHRQHKQTCNKYDGLIKENKNLVEKVNKCKCDSPPDIAKNNNNEILVKNLENEKINLQSEKDELLVAQNDFEKRVKSLTDEVGRLQELKKTDDLTKVALETNQEHLEKERDMFHSKYDSACNDLDKLAKEKAHFALTVETLREENRRLNNAVHKRVISPSQDPGVHRLQEENESHKQEIDLLKSNLTNAINENKRLLGRINRSDENVATTIRSLKARKNELQLQVETLKHENEYLKKLPKAKEKKHRFGRSSADSSNSETIVNESLRTAHTKLAELQLDNEEMRCKLLEYEGLLNEQHQALAHANDLAMQKNLENSKMKRSMEKKLEKISSENNELRRIIFLLDDSNMSNDSTRTSPPVAEKSKTIEGPNVESIFSSDDSTTTGEKISPRNNPLTTFSTFSSHTEPSLSSVSSVPGSHSLMTSRQLESDLSDQLRELLDLSNDLVPEEEDKRSQVSEESLAPPVPPPPPHYGSPLRREEEVDGQRNMYKEAIEQIVQRKLEYWV